VVMPKKSVRCQGVNRFGEQCQSHTWRGSTFYCFAHSRPAEFKAAQIRGARARKPGQRKRWAVGARQLLVRLDPQLRAEVLSQLEAKDDKFAAAIKTSGPGL
jgi:hypothetical protein